MGLKDDIYQRALTARVSNLVFHPERQPKRRPQGYLPTGITLVDDAVRQMGLPIAYDVMADGNPNNPFTDRRDLSIHLLTPEAFDFPSMYAHAVVHEHMHATGGKLDMSNPASGITVSHLRRPIVDVPLEELVADMATAMVLERAGVDWPHQLEIVSQYVATWLPRSHYYVEHIHEMDRFFAILTGDVLGDDGQPRRPTNWRERTAWNEVYNQCWGKAEEAYNYFIGA